MNSCSTDPAAITLDQAMALPAKQKRLYFEKILVKHPMVNTVLSDLQTMIMPESGTDIALLIGPTGVGKSTLCSSLKSLVINLEKKEIEEDPSFIPVVLINAPASGEKSFSWRIFYTTLGKALNEPMMDQKQEYNLQDGQYSVKRFPSGSTVAALQMSVADILKYRRTLLIILDEAAHLIRNAKGDTLLANMDALKSLTQMGGNPTLALVGSYDLYQLMCLNGQLARRSGIVHFRRYTFGVSSDELAFHRTFKLLLKHIPLHDVPDFNNVSNDLMRACIGCIGILKQTLQRALVFALDNNSKLTESCLEKALLAEGQVAKILEETLTGEESIKNAVFGTASLWRRK